MFNTNQPVPVDVAFADFRNVPYEERETMRHQFAINLEWTDEEFDDEDDELEGLSIVSESEVFSCLEELDLF